MQSERRNEDVFRSFDLMDLSDSLLKGIYRCGYREPSVIQQKAIAPIIKGKDVIAQAQTGTGKTAAFGISALQRINTNSPKLQALILSPTRELATQTTDALAMLGQFMGVRIATCIGGSKVSEDERALHANPHIVSGTPGRVLDLVGRGTINLSDIEMLIIDEADELFDRDFLKDVTAVLAQRGVRTQTVLFCATFPPEIKKLTELIEHPVRITNEEQLTSSNLENYRVHAGEHKLDTVLDLYHRMTISQAVIFCNTKGTVIELATALSRHGCPTAQMHSGHKQADRDNAMDEFRSGRKRTLVCTDIWARGIDVPQVNVVINFDVPNDNDTFVHRIGRAGRFGRRGTSITLATDGDVLNLEEAEAHFGLTIKDLHQDQIDHGVARTAEKAVKGILNFLTEATLVKTANQLDMLTHPVVEVDLALVDSFNASVHQTHLPPFLLQAVAGIVRLLCVARENLALAYRVTEMVARLIAKHITAADAVSSRIVGHASVLLAHLYVHKVASVVVVRDVVDLILDNWSDNALWNVMQIMELTMSAMRHDSKTTLDQIVSRIKQKAGTVTQPSRRARIYVETIAELHSERSKPPAVLPGELSHVPKAVTLKDYQRAEKFGRWWLGASEVAEVRREKGLSEHQRHLEYAGQLGMNTEARKLLVAGLLNIHWQVMGPTRHGSELLKIAGKNQEDLPIAIAACAEHDPNPTAFYARLAVETAKSELTGASKRWARVWSDAFTRDGEKLAGLKDKEVVRLAIVYAGLIAADIMPLHKLGLVMGDHHLGGKHGKRMDLFARSLLVRLLGSAGVAPVAVMVTGRSVKAVTKEGRARAIDRVAGNLSDLRRKLDGEEKKEKDKIRKICDMTLVDFDTVSANVHKAHAVIVKETRTVVKSMADRKRVKAELRLG
ncbi:DEAD/DEAH box helicase [Carpediemonas membranifera]|uniref:DEAD/DEAH box helicase n=1 Tax=Carpediemonas membranifera TaxID=201153 RepID=A0A8J6DXS9_9EUKA|nr:DEAD/DEAH box helicase [Carpediemonas membranifera]|eukprot:KAG9390909.1 DEAD/DEAH box helicase [Carpediemonas membranifera]